MPPVGDSEGVDCLKTAVRCQAGCHLVAEFVAGKSPVYVLKMPINKGFLIGIYISGNESNEILQENLKSKKSGPDVSLQVLWGSLPDFVAGAAVWPLVLWR